ncbi:MAG TPA: hypothetical protein VIQ30_18045 [Pseudonocardia sp.]
MVWRLKRRPKTPPPPGRAASIQRAEQERAKARLLAQARQRQAEHRYDGLTR